MAEEHKPKDQNANKEATSIVRIAGKDINGNYRIEKALNQVKGIGHNLSHAIAIAAHAKFGIDPNSSIGSISEESIANLEKVISNPSNFGVPKYLLNRRKDAETGQDMHLVGSDLTIKVRYDIDNDIKLQTWRGFRHQFGQKVRGQRTRSTGRTGVTVGVTKKAAEAALAAQKASAPGEQKKEAKEKK